LEKRDLLLGFLIGIAASFLGVFLFLTLFTEYDFIHGISILKSQGSLGKLMTLGALLDLVAFGVLLKMNKEMMSRGVVLAVIIIAIVTMFA
jgi:hypothetical protein